MKTAFVLCLIIASRAATACSCFRPTVEDAEKSADVIFRGTITEIKEAAVYFQVVQVWKGSVGKVFTMPEVREQAGCGGFWTDYLRVGNDLLVYANWSASTSENDGVYFTTICTRTQLARDAGYDFWKLGPQPHFRSWASLSLALCGMGVGLLFQRFPRHSGDAPT